MFEKDLSVALLLDFYGEVLSARSRAIMEYYYGDDLSLSEIAESEGISRQGVRHIIKKAEEEIIFLEEKLGLAAQFREIAGTAEELNHLADTLSGRFNDDDIRALTERMHRVSALLLGKQIKQEDHGVSESDR